MAQQVNQYGVCTQYQEVYVPGGYDQYGNYYQGGVQTQSYNVPCSQVNGGNWNPSNQYNTATSEKLINYLIRNKHWSPLEMVNVCLETNLLEL